MSRLNNLYQNIKNHSRQIGFCFGIIAALTGIRGCVKGIGEELYRGKINGQEVVYEEGILDFFVQSPVSARNIMTIKEGDITYIFEDRREEIGIDWKKETKPLFKGDRLERVCIIKGENERWYGGLAPDPDVNTIDGKHTKEILDRATIKYNELRVQIRKELRDRYEKEHSPLEEAIGENEIPEELVEATPQ